MALNNIATEFNQFQRNTVRRKIFAINNFHEIRKWSTFTNIIIANLYVRTYTVYQSTHYYNYSDVALRWQTSTEALFLVKPSSGRSSMGS